MSSRIDQTLAVLHEITIRQAYLASMRRRAVVEVAKQFGLRPETVADKLVRQQSPDVQDVRAFDRLVALWLGGCDRPLLSVLLAHAVSADDRTSIRRFFETEAASGVGDESDSVLP